MKTKVFLLPLVTFAETYPELTKREIERIAGDYALKKVFSDLFGITEIQINRERKPYIKDCPYHFNLSHSGEYLLLAVADVPVGADIEKITKIRPKTMEKYFSDAEQAHVMKEGKTAFFEIWTKKESYVKYTGEGIKGLMKTNFYPENIAFFQTIYENHQIAVCTDVLHLPDEIEFLNLIA